MTNPPATKIGIKNLDQQKQVQVEELIKEIRQLTVKSKLNPDGQYQLIRWGANIVLGNPQAQIVARISQSSGYKHLKKQLKIYQKLARLGAPIVKPIFKKPLYLETGQTVTFWPMLKTTNYVPGKDFVRLVGDCQKLKKLKELKVYRPEMTIQRRQAMIQKGKNQGLPGKIEKQILKKLDEEFINIKTALLAEKRPRQFCHGDLYYGNVVYQEKRPLLCDLDTICYGPLELDLAQIFLDYRYRQKKPNQWQQFLKLYQSDFSQKLLEAFIKLQLVGEVCFSASLWGVQPGCQEIIEKRLKNLENPDDCEFWHH